ncbi:MAG: hypothetical protein KDD66_01260 [Bdellovibrionales bacterium]|nr:hypothetical protein [Bdellovibrionales bacterium]
MKKTQRIFLLILLMAVPLSSSYAEQDNHEKVSKQTTPLIKPQPQDNQEMGPAELRPAILKRKLNKFPILIEA